MSNPLTFPVFFSFFSLFCCWFVLVSCFFFFFFFSSSTLPSSFLSFFSFFLFASVCSSVCCSFVLVFFFFLFVFFPSFNSSIFPCPSRWCRVVMLKTVVYGNQVRFESLKNSAGTSTKSDKCYIVTHVDSHLHTCTYICRITHNDTTSKTDAWRKTPEGRHRKKRRRKDFFRKIFYLSLYCKGSKGLLKGCMWEGAGDRT